MSIELIDRVVIDTEEETPTSKEIISLWDAFYRITGEMTKAQKNNDRQSYILHMQDRKPVIQALTAAGHFSN